MTLPHWEYFLSIEADLERCSRFVEFSPNNYKTYSIEFARIIMAAASEFDTVAKLLCSCIDPSQTPSSINFYHSIIISKYPRFVEFEILMSRYKLTFIPWNNWEVGNSPNWWSKGYNKIKHERDQYFHEANLENAILATCGLLAGILYYYDSKFGGIMPMIDLFQSPKLLMPQHYSPDGYDPGGIFWDYNLLK
jgi:hypothetical protein